jgi:competence protein ComGF
METKIYTLIKLVIALLIVVSVALLLVCALFILLYKAEQKRQRNLLEDKMIHLLDSFIEFLKDSTQETFDYYSQKNGRLVQLRISLKDFKDMCDRAQESKKDIGIEVSVDYAFYVRYISDSQISLVVHSHLKKNTGRYDLWYGRQIEMRIQ